MTSQDLEAALLNLFQTQALSLPALIGIASLDCKQDSVALVNLAQAWGLDLQFFSREQLNAVWTPHPSEKVFAQVQAWSVAEAASLLGAQPVRLIVPKQIYWTASHNAITLAISQVCDHSPV